MDALALLAGAAAVVYGGATLTAGLAARGTDRLPAGHAWAVVAAGALTTLGGVLVGVEWDPGAWVVLAGVAATAALTVRASMHLQRRVEPSHHIARALISAGLVVLAFLAAQD